MSATEIREKARRLEAATLRGYWISAVVGLLGIGFSFYVALLRGQAAAPPGMPERIIVGIIALIFCGGFLKQLYTTYRIHGRVWPRIVTPGAELMTCLDFYRRELEHRRNSLSYPKTAIFCVVSGLVSLFMFRIVATSQSIPIRAVLPAMITIALLFGASTVLLFYEWKRDVRNLRREIDQLDHSAKQL
jgi:hypothetical protein